jgi:hypothetical protein
MGDEGVEREMKRIFSVEYVDYLLCVHSFICVRVHMIYFDKHGEKLKVLMNLFSFLQRIYIVSVVTIQGIEWWRYVECHYFKEDDRRNSQKVLFCLTMLISTMINCSYVRCR